MVQRVYRISIFLCLSLLLSLVLSGCRSAIPSPALRAAQAETYVASDPQLERHVYTATLFNLLAYQPKSPCSGEIMHLYIEGDGLAWKTSRLVSNDPTPLNPLALKLMLRDPTANKIYLARPCQYVSNDACQRKYWTSHRFSRDVIADYLQVLDQIKLEYGVKSFVLFGYSGGGAIATLIAAQRDDISTLVTVAGNLDTAFWTRKHYLAPLIGSLNPADYSDSLGRLTQYHLVGGRDRVIDESVFLSYQSRFVDKSSLNVQVYDPFSHSQGWESQWRTILTSMSL